MLAPPALIEAATVVQDELRALWPRGAVRWVEPRNFHVTVRFFGDLGPEDVARVVALVRGTEFVRLEVRLGRCSAFPNETRPGVLWLGLEDVAGRIPEFVRRVDADLEAAGFGPPDKPWKSHLTLGRVPRDGGFRARPEEFRSVPVPRERFHLDEFALVKSELRREGPVYTSIEIVRGREPGRLGEHA